MYEKNQKQGMSYTKETIEEVLKYKCLRVPEHVPLEAAEYFGIRSAVSEKDGKTIEATYFPYYDQQNRLIGFKKRDWTKPKSEKGHFGVVGKVTTDCKMFGQHKAPANPKKILLVEGETDLAVAWYAIQEHLKGLDKKYHPSFAIVSLPLGCGNAAACASTNSKWLLSAQEIILALDNDERQPNEKKNVVRGKEATEDIYSVLLSKQVKSLDWPEGNKDARDYATACLQAKDTKAFYDLLFYGAKSYSGSKIASPHDYSFEEMEQPIPEGLYIDEFPKLMELVRGIRKFELTMVTAPSGAGKTTVVSTIMGGISQKDQKVGIIFLEEENKDTLKRMQAYKMQVPFDDLFFNPTECGTIEERRAAWEWVAERNEDGSSKRFSLMNHFGSIHTQDLMDKIKQLVFIEKCDYIVLDHISIVVSGNESDNERKDIDILMSNLAAFVAVNPVGIIAVSHINRVGSTSAGPRKGKEDEAYWVEVKKEHLRGSSAIEGLCWNIWGVEPEIMPDRSRGRIRLVNLKNRKAKKLGVADVLRMNETTGVLEDASVEVTYTQDTAEF